MAGIGSMRETINLITPVLVRYIAGFTTANDRIVSRCGRIGKSGMPLVRG